jgi:peptidoglycan/LPS O-acetylase OafA/YrhL
MRTNRILELDGLRAIAVIAVIIFHMWGWAGAIPKTNPIVNSLISCFGPAGVYVFFVISGFIITSLLIREQNERGSISLSAFYIRRFFRIIPPLVGYIVGLFLLTQIGYLSVKPINYVWSLLFLGNYGLFDGIGENFLGHTWSLSIEEQYYLILPPIMITILRFRMRPINNLLIVLFCISLLSLNIAKTLSVHVYPGLINIAAFFKFRYIIVGVLIALHRGLVQKLVANKSAFLSVTLLLLIFIIHEYPFPSLLGLLLNGVEPLLWGLFIMWFVENPDKCAFLRWRIVQWIGTCSYSIYLWQQLFTNPATSYNEATISTSPLAIVPILLTGAISYYLIEKPNIRLGRYVSTKLLNRRNKAKILVELRTA